MRLSFIFLINIASFAVAAGKNRLMAWMCLEFCEETPQIINANMHEIEEHRDLFAAVSFEKYTLGPESSLVDNNLTEVASKIVGMHLEAWPLLSSFPHPPEFIDWMRYVFANPDPFIARCVSEAKLYNYTGYNLDWEPTDEVSSEDGQAYATFIDYFAQELHKESLLLSVDIATWSPIWNYTALASTRADYFVSMGTYTSTDSSYSTQLDKLVSAFGPGRSGVGLETVNASTEELMPLNEVAWRFQLLEESGVKEVDLWKMPVPMDWWPIIKKFVYIDN